MSAVPYIRAEDVEHLLTWPKMVDALHAGHRQNPAKISDQFLRRGDDTLMARAAWIDGFGAAVKTFTVLPENPARGLPSVQGAMVLFADETGEVEAILDFDLVTKWKTIADSLLGVRLLARPDARRVLIVGTGRVAANLVAAYRAFLPDCEISIWGRDPAKAAALGPVVEDLERAVRGADIISCATMANTPLIKGEWLQTGQHLDLIGAFKADMREADDLAMQRSKLFVDSRTSAAHVGEIAIPLASGAIAASDILADLYENPERRSADDITLFKNAGGAHLDLMVGREILRVWKNIPS